MSAIERRKPMHTRWQVLVKAGYKLELVRPGPREAPFYVCTTPSGNRLCGNNLRRIKKRAADHYKAST